MKTLTKYIARFLSSFSTVVQVLGYHIEILGCKLCPPFSYTPSCIIAALANRMCIVFTYTFQNTCSFDVGTVQLEAGISHNAATPGCAASTTRSRCTGATRGRHLQPHRAAAPPGQPRPVASRESRARPRRPARAVQQRPSMPPLVFCGGGLTITQSLEIVIKN